MKTIIIDGIEYNLTPKVLFKKGDWVVSPNGVYWHIDAINNNRYEVSSTDGACADLPLDTDLYHLWTIQDAEGGDVLVNWNNTTFIFKAIEDESVKFHIAYNEKWDTIKIPSTKLSHLGLPEPQFEFHPATKEQRDTLMKAMADAGYTFDFERKELKKIEQKPAWSEEDEEILNLIIARLHSHPNVDAEEYGKDYHWFNYLKDRVQPQSKQGCCECDEIDIQTAIEICKNAGYDLIANRLKSLRPQNRWKPSDEQMENLSRAFNGATYNNSLLMDLYIDLKKLREE